MLDYINIFQTTLVGQFKTSYCPPPPLPSLFFKKVLLRLGGAWYIKFLISTLFFNISCLYQLNVFNSTACKIRAVHYFYLLLLGLLFSINGTRPGVLNIYLGKPEILVGKSNGWRNSVWEASENNYGMWSVIWGDAIFPLFLVFSANLEILRSGSFS